MDDFTGLVKFSAEWCSPCKSFAPILKTAAEEAGVAVKDVDIDEEAEVASQFGIRSVPTTIAFVDGKPIDMIVGSVSKERVLELASKINNNNS